MFYRLCHRSLRVALSCAALAIVCDANQAANRFMDSALASMRLMAHQNGLDPLQAHAFKVKVKATGITNRDFEANFTRSYLYGLGSLRRIGECSYGASGKLMKLGCYVSLKSTFFLSNADVKGDSITGSIHSISTNSTVSPKVVGLIEVTGLKGDTASFNRLYVDPKSLSRSMTTRLIQGHLSLNEKRLNEFWRYTNGFLSFRFVSSLRSLYTYALKLALSQMRMP